VDREALWHHLQHVNGVPSQLLTVIHNMYSGDAYRLVDGLTCTPPICPSKGVWQGCPLSPILLALFLSDVGAAFGVWHPTGRMGRPLQHLERGQSGVRHVTHPLFADDLAVVGTSQERLQSQMHSLLRYANGSPGPPEPRVETNTHPAPSACAAQPPDQEVAQTAPKPHSEVCRVGEDRHSLPVAPSVVSLGNGQSGRGPMDLYWAQDGASWVWQWGMFCPRHWCAVGHVLSPPLVRTLTPWTQCMRGP
jgi:hypothetical protein